MLRFPGALVLVFGLSLLGCGGDGGTDGDNGSTSAVEEVVIPPCEGEALTFSATTTNVYAGVSSGGYVVLQGVAEGDTVSDWMIVEMTAGFGGPTNVGTLMVLPGYLHSTVLCWYQSDDGTGPIGPNCNYLVPKGRTLRIK